MTIAKKAKTENIDGNNDITSSDSHTSFKNTFWYLLIDINGIEKIL